MNNKIDELTARLFREGVEKGNQKGAELIAEAEARAASLVEEAQKEAERRLAQAQRDSEELRRNVETELKMVGAQVLGQVKGELTDLILTKSVEAPIQGALTDATVMAQLLQTIAAQWAGQTGAPALEVILPEAEREKLDKAFRSALSAELKKGMTLSFSSRIRNGFQVQPAGEGYKLGFTDEDFAELFKDHLRPRTREMLFGS